MKLQDIPGIFIAGTDTDVGKTVVAALLVRGLHAAYWKPIQCGIEPSTDSERVRRLTACDATDILPEKYRLKAPLSPHLAAQREGVSIDLNDLEVPATFQKSGRASLIVEGAGGILVPLNREQYMLDLMVALDLPVLLVARSGLGTINHTLLSTRVLGDAGVPILGVVMNGPINRDNRQAIEQYSSIPVLAELAPQDVLTPQKLDLLFTQLFGE